VQAHLSLGATRRVGEAGELSLSYVHAFEETVSGSGSIPAAFGGGEVDLGMKQHSLGIAYSRKF
jgi:long-chain fatty acid transport protein